MKIISEHPALLRPRKYESVSHILRPWSRWISILNAHRIASHNPRGKHPRRDRSNDDKKECNLLSSVHVTVSNLKDNTGPKMRAGIVDDIGPGLRLFHG